LITHNDTPQSVGFLWMSDQLVTETSIWQQTTHTTNIHARGGIRTHDHSRWAAVDLCLWLCGHWDRLWIYIKTLKYENVFPKILKLNIYSLYGKNNDWKLQCNNIRYIPHIF
jgi:hypothetical protein